MARERSNPQLSRTFKRLGGYAEKKTDLWHALRAMNAARGTPDPGAADAEPGGHPDYLWLVPPYGGFAEVKDGEDRFAFDAISPKQRAWLTAWDTISWLWLFMGTGRAGSRQRAAYFIPWPDWLAIETRAAEQGLRGLAWQAPHQRRHRALGLSVAELCADYALTWHGAGAWDLPYPAHPFWQRPPEQGFLFRPRREHKENTQALQETPCHDQLPLSLRAAGLAPVAARPGAPGCAD